MTNKPSILLTGGAGYIGSHTYVALIEAGFTPVILDDFSNSKPAVLARLQRITDQAVQCQHGSVVDVDLVQGLIERHQIAAVIHFAGFKAVGESVAQPLKYFENNLGGMMALLRAMQLAARWFFPAAPRCMATRPVYQLPKVFRAATPTPMATPSSCVKTC
jgi:UDP-glucose 4-epimerase